MDVGVILVGAIGSAGVRGRVQISGDAARDIAQAVRFEHPCDDSTCNITASLRAGHPLVAAWILARSGPAPFLQAVLAEYQMDPQAVPKEVDEWKRHASTISVRCDACARFTYDESRDWFTGRPCQNCGARLPVAGRAA